MLRLQALTLAAFLALSIPARADNIYQTVSQSLGFSQGIALVLTQFIPAPPIATQSIKILAIQVMAIAVSGGTPVELEYGTGVNCGTGTQIFAVLTTSSTSAQATTNNLELGDGRSVVYTIPAGNAACVKEAGATGLQGQLAGTYIYY